LSPEKEIKKSHVAACLENRQGPVISATDYIHLYADQIRSAIDAPYYVLGTDGFGRSDTRVQLRHYFEVDAKMIVYVALKALHDEGVFEQAALIKAREDLGIDPNKLEPIKG
jgi:pyruvate dehydrogenase E1 component